MKRTRFTAFIQSLLSIRSDLPDETALSHADFYPAWQADSSYQTGDRVLYDGILYKCLQSHDAQDAWTPSDAPSLWARVLIPDQEVIPEWIQPDSTNAYMTGDKVRHGGKVWESLIDNNVWEPGVYGWEEVSQT